MLGDLFQAVAEARGRGDHSGAARLALSAVPGLRNLAADQPLLAGEALELVADLRRASAGDSRLKHGEAKDLGLYLESVRLRSPRSYPVAAAALKAASIARRLKREKALREAIAFAAQCEEDFPARMARETLAELLAGKRDFGGAADERSPHPLSRVGDAQGGRFEARRAVDRESAEERCVLRRGEQKEGRGAGEVPRRQVEEAAQGVRHDLGAHREGLRVAGESGRVRELQG
jgi:hypothetical protein